MSHPSGKFSKSSSIGGLFEAVGPVESAPGPPEAVGTEMVAGLLLVAIEDTIATAADDDDDADDEEGSL